MPLRQLLLPARCVFCRTACRGDEADICGACLADLPWHMQLFAAPPRPLQLVAAPLEYAFPVDAALKSFKFRRRLEYGPAFAELLYRVLPQLPTDIDALLPMPLHWQRQALRGFNQADELVRVLRRRSGLPILRSVRRIRATSSQSGLNATARRQNLRAAFQAKENIDACHILIVDDVITTGESCRQLASTVLGSGAGKVSAMSVARTTTVSANGVISETAGSPASA